MSGVAALAVTRLSKSFGWLRAVLQIDLSLAPGERHALIGPNGAGKTTLFNLIAGELAPTAGRIALFGQDVTRLPPQRRAALGLARTFQVNTLFPSLTVTENLLLAVQGTLPTKLRLHRPISSYRDLYDRARAVLESVGLVGAADRRRIALGDTMNVAARLQSAAEPGTILTGGRTAEELRDRFLLVANLRDAIHFVARAAHRRRR